MQAQPTNDRKNRNGVKPLPTFAIICGWKNASVRLNRDYNIQELEAILKTKNITVTLEKGAKKPQLTKAITDYCNTTIPPVAIVEEKKEKVETNVLTEELDKDYDDYDDFRSVSSGFSDDEDDNNYDICLRKCNAQEIQLINTTRKSMENKNIEELQMMLKELNIKDTLSCDDYEKHINKGILISYLCRNALDKFKATKK